MKPILFPPEATAFQSLGYGVLVDATSCLVTEERNGVFELTMVYPQTGRLFSKLINRSILYCPVDASGRKEPFRVYKITKPKSGLITIYAAHLSYDLSGIVVAPFSAANAIDAMAKIKPNSATSNPFSFWTNIDSTASFAVNAPATIRSFMGGGDGSLLDVYGGEYSYENYTVKLHARRGENRGVTIRYGKNLVDLTQEENIQDAYTGVYPFWTSENNYVELPERILIADGNYGFEKIRPLDASSEFDDPPTERDLREYAKRYMDENNIGVPKISISVSFVPLEQSDEYRNIAPLQQVLLCDTVSVKFESLGIDAVAKCIKTVFNVLTDRYEKIELGEARTNIADTIAGQAQSLKQVQDPSFIQSFISSTAATHVLSHSKTNAGASRELSILEAVMRLKCSGADRFVLSADDDSGDIIISLNAADQTVKTQISQEQIMTPYISPTDTDQMAWEYVSEIGKTILVKK